MTDHPGRNPYLRANSLTELLSWHDVNFVRCAYVTVLGRQPDPSGERHYTMLLRSGRSKLDILWQIRRSREARRHDPGIAGFDRTLKKAAWARKPVIGSIVRLFSGGENDDRLARIQRSIVNEVGSIKDMIGYTDAVAVPLGSGRRSPHRIQTSSSNNRSAKARRNLSPSGARAFDILVGEASR